MTWNLEQYGWKHIASGKVREIYAPIDASSPALVDRYLIVTTDRISAYDHILPTPIPDKGKILNQLSIWWMRECKDIIPHHLLTDDSGDLLPVPDEVAGRAVIVKALDMIPVECVVRGYLTGSGLAEYRRIGSVCEIGLPEGLTEASELENAIFTPAAKAEQGEHDENVSYRKVVAMVGEDIARQLRDISLALYERGRATALERDLIVADTKFELGIDRATGTLVLGDEVLTPDSSRIWPRDAWKPGTVTPSFDKQYLRDWLTSPASGWDRASDTPPPPLPEDIVAATRERYIEAFRRITGTEPVL
ncbi:MAG: phosphoribosylaminoimidazolesuccinocarboxamide synthase [Actinomycetaceae bacterium]|nr:phosphoribosylaminoimidazolesuccinocarboxamide synthase [Actinomycetaceae bacterium]